jgi:hypothetical protein
MFSVALSVGTPHGVASRVYLRVNRRRRSVSGARKLRGIASYGVRTFLPPGLPRRSDPPPFQNQGYINAGRELIKREYGAAIRMLAACWT